MNTFKKKLLIDGTETSIHEELNTCGSLSQVFELAYTSLIAMGMKAVSTEQVNFNNDQEYFDYNALSQSTLKHFYISDKYGHSKLQEQVKPTKAMQLGTVVHRALLEPDQYQQYSTHIPYPDTPQYEDIPLLGKKADYPSDDAYYRMKELRTELKAQNDEKKADFNAIKEEIDAKNALNEARGGIISQENKTIADEIRKNLYNKSNYKAMLYNKNCQFELPIVSKLTFNTPHLTELKLKSKIDALCDEEGNQYIIDLKTTFSIANDRQFKYKIDDLHYDLQAFFYLFNLYSCELIDFESPYYILAVETKQPYDAKLYQLSERLLMRGGHKFLKAFCNFYDYNEAIYKNEDLKGYTESIYLLDL